MDFFEFRQLNEAFDKPYKFTSRGLNKKQGSVSYNFETEVEDPRFDDPSDIEVYFETDKEEEPNYTISFDRDGSTSVTGEGDAMRVFATVIAILKDFTKKEKPQEVGFGAWKSTAQLNLPAGHPKTKELGSREKLYKKLVQRYAGRMGYKYTTKTDDMATDFRLVRK